MKTKLLKENLQKTVIITNRFVPLKPNLPVLANIFLEATKTTLVLKATNLESSVFLEVPASSTQEGAVTVPAKIFNEFLTNLDGKEVSLSLDKENLVIESGNTKGTVATIAANEFPNLPKTEENKTSIKFSQKDLNEAVNNVIFACSVDEGKPILNGIFLGKLETKTVLVGTDGYRLSMKELNEKINLNDVVIPAKTFSEAIKVAGEMEESQIEVLVSEEENQLIIKGTNFEVSTRLLAGTYPQFSQIIPSKFVTRVVTSKEDAIRAVKIAAVFAKDIGNVVTLSLQNKKTIEVTAKTLQIGEGKASFDGIIEGDNLEISFNSRYLLEGLNSINNDELEIDFSGSLSPALIKNLKDPSRTYIVMPVKPQK